MKNKSKIKFNDLSDKVRKPEMKPLSDAETNQIVGGKSITVDCRWCRPGRPGRPGYG